MALLKDVPLGSTGIVLRYWALSRFDVDMNSNIATVTLSGYVSKQDRIDGKSPLENKVVRWIGSENPITRERLLAGQAFSYAYEKLMAQSSSPFNPNPFEGATADI